MSRLVVLLACLAVAIAAPSKKNDKRQIFYTSPVAEVAEVYPAAVSHQTRVDVHTSPAVVATVAEPVLTKTVVASSPAVVASHPLVASSPAVVASVAQPLVTKTVYHQPSVVASAPVYGRTIYAPNVVAHQTPAVVAAVPSFVESRSAWDPVYSTYAKPVYSTYSKPVYSTYAW